MTAIGIERLLRQWSIDEILEAMFAPSYGAD
jgi:hypothetical protein